MLGPLEGGVLDGNAIGGLLMSLFGTDMTAATGTCGFCGTVAQVAELAVYQSDLGAVVRCRTCDGVLMVVRSNSTPVDMARRARQEFPDETLVGIVLNGTNPDILPYTRYYYDQDQSSTNESKT